MLSTFKKIWVGVAAFLGLAYIGFILHSQRTEPIPQNLTSRPWSNENPTHNKEFAEHSIATAQSTVIAYPNDYVSKSDNGEECNALYGEQYLTHLASHHTPYCEDGSQSGFECFRTHKNETTCIATSVLMDPFRQEPQRKIAMHCQLRDFTAERAADPAKAELLSGVQNVEDMPSGFFATGVKEQLKYWDIQPHDLNMQSTSGSLCEAKTSDGNWTLLVRRENNENFWHRLMEFWQSMVTLDVLQMAINPSTGNPYLSASDIPNIQILLTRNDAGFVDPFGVDHLWELITGNKPQFEIQMTAPACLGKVILPLYGSSSPYWAHAWDEADCRNTFLIDAFVKRVYGWLGIVPKRHGTETNNTIVTIIDRKGSRKLKDMETYVANAKARWPEVTFQTIDFASMHLAEQIKVIRETDVLLGLHGAGLTHIFWLPEESSVIEIQAPNRREPDGRPYTLFRNLAKARNINYFTGHPEREEGGDWQAAEWVEIKNEVFQALVDAAINAQMHRGSSAGEVLPRPLPS
ncbi:hypothetical protein B0J14DRAFT_585578 [Halenospora varia]|nr:hypothetical protein B0J14DRAFT_585578 [Halenospora varia]